MSSFAGGKARIGESARQIRKSYFDGGNLLEAEV